MPAPAKRETSPVTKPVVGIVMGSTSDWEVMQHAARSLADFGVAYEARALSAHRSPDALIDWVEGLAKQGAKCFIAGAGGAAHLAGVVAAKTALPVLAVPMPSKHLQGLDSLLSMVQMPKGIPVATFAIGDAGAANAGLFAVAMLALNDAALAKKLADFRKKQADAVLAARLPDLK
jgi:5-(carboxyamino)imidazole ribonucleotide mutase